MKTKLISFLRRFLRNQGNSNKNADKLLSSGIRTRLVPKEIIEQIEVYEPIELDELGNIKNKDESPFFKPIIHDL